MDTANKPKRKLKIRRKIVESSTSVSSDQTTDVKKRRLKIRRKKTKTSSSAESSAKKIDISSLSDTMSSFLVSSTQESSRISQETRAKETEQRQPNK